MIPPVLSEVAEFLSQSDFDLVTGNDPRMDSNQSENKIVQLLQNAGKWEEVYSPNVKSGNNRSWYDVKIEGYFVNIKISRFTGRDDTNAKRAIYYLLTGLPPDQVSSTSSIFFRKMRENEDEDNDRDYYYLVINKDNLSDVFVTSLKGLKDAAPDHLSQPFQSNWNLCRETVDRNWREAKIFLLGLWSEAIKKSIEIQNKGMPSAYPEFFIQDNE